MKRHGTPISLWQRCGFSSRVDTELLPLARQMNNALLERMFCQRVMPSRLTGVHAALSHNNPPKRPA